MNEDNDSAASSLVADIEATAGPALGAQVWNIYSGLRGRVTWVDGKVFKLDNPSARGHYQWNDSWRIEEQ